MQLLLNTKGVPFRVSYIKRLRHNSIVMDKPAIKITKAKKGLDPLYSIRGLLAADCFNLLRVHFNPIYTYNKPKVLRAFYPKFIFLNINL